MSISLTFPAHAGTVIRHLFLLIGLIFLSSCVHRDNTIKLPSENYNSRVSLIVIHHTVANFKDSVDILTNASSNSVSSHYLVPEPDDKTYAQGKLKIFQLVPESQRAWHAGRSYWAGKTGLNDQSIGIELVNQVHCVEADIEEDAPEASSDSTDQADEGDQPEDLCFFPDFAESQIDILIDLLGDIQKRHPQIHPTNIVAHSDIAPSRKVDPGPRFPWQRLYRLGFGAWYDDDTVTRYWNRFITTPLPLVNIQKALLAYGYGVEDTGVLDQQTRHALRAFQMHFRPSMVTGKPTLQSTAVLYALIEKYRPGMLDDLLIIAPQTEDRATISNEQ